MDDVSLFLVCVLAISTICRNKRILFGDFFEIHWKKQPIMFVAVVIAICSFMFDALFSLLNLFVAFNFSEDDMFFIDCIFFFASSFVVAIAFAIEGEITVMKKNYTWQDAPLIRSSILVAFLSISFFFLKRLVSCP